MVDLSSAACQLAACQLIVNADDFGASPAVNAGVIRAHVEGIVTSTSLMVRGAAAASAAEYARRHPDLAVGLHIDLAEWACRDGEWTTLYQVVALDDEAAIGREVDAQLDSFVRLTGRPPTHLDSHQHLHRDEPVRSIVGEAGQRLGVPVREADPAIRYCGSFYGQCDDGTPFPEGISVGHLLSLISSLPPGVTELGCHPASGVDLEESMYRHERPVELAALCDPRVRQAINDAGVQLLSFAEIAAPAAHPGALR